MADDDTTTPGDRNDADRRDGYHFGDFNDSGAENGDGLHFNDADLDAAMADFEREFDQTQQSEDQEADFSQGEASFADLSLIHI